MCIIEQNLNNFTEDLIIFTNRLARSDLATATEGFDYRWWLNIAPISFAQLHTSKPDAADVSADLDPLYTVRNILFEATFFERMSFFEVRVSYNIVFTTAIALTHVIGHVTLRPVLRAEWSDHGQTTGRGASRASLWSRWLH